MFFSDGAWFTLNGNVNSQNNAYWCSENCHVFHKVPVHDIKFTVWRACVCTNHSSCVLQRNSKFISLLINSDTILQRINTVLFHAQQCHSAHTANFLMTRRGIQWTTDTWHIVSSKISRLNLCKQYLWGTLKDILHVNNPQSLLELMDHTQWKTAYVSRNSWCTVTSISLKQCHKATCSESVVQKDKNTKIATHEM